jgi:hypothetical protein
MQKLKWVAAFAMGALGTLLALIVAFEHGRSTHTPAEFDGAMARAAYSRLDIYLPGTTIYVLSRSSDGLLEALHTDHPKLVLLPWSSRPPEPGCHDDASGCHRDDFISVDVVSFPFWRTALVEFSAYNGGGESLLLNVGGSWQVIGTRAVLESNPEAHPAP